MLAVEYADTLLGGGTLAVATVILVVAAKVPGPTKWLFERLVKEPIERWHDARTDEKITTGLGLQADMVRQQVQDQLAPIAIEVKQVNEAVNNVGPLHPKLKDRVAGLEAGQKVMDGKLDTITDMVGALIQRG